MSVNYDQRLLLMVIVLGTLGSYVHAANSFADYVGNRQLFWSWMPWYALRPLVGAPTAIFLYFVMRAGFLTASASGGDINRFGIGAIAGLSGLFSVKAGDKLKEVFDTLFKTEEKRKDALQKPQDGRGGKFALEITTLNLPDGIVGEAYRHSLRARRGTVPFTWTVTPALPSGLALDSNTGNISGVPTAVSAKSSYRFTVKDSATIAESSAVDLTLEIK